MAFTNNIDYAAIFNRVLDEKFYIMPKTLWMENTNPGIEWTGGKEIKIPKISMNGLGTMNGYKAPDGDLTLGYETKTLQWYRGRNFAIGRYDVDETNLTMTVGNALKVFLAEHVVPEIDKLRIAKLAQNAMGYGATCVTQQAASGITASNIFDLLMADIAKVQDKIGEDEQLYIQISTQLKSLLERSAQITRYMDVKDLAIRAVNVKVNTLNDEYLLSTPSSYMHSVFDLLDGVSAGQTVGGVTFANMGPAVNWIIAARPVADAVARPQVTKVIDPDMNQEGEFWKIMFSVYHGMWTMDNKADGVLVNVDPTLGTLTVTSTAGTASGTTVITVANAPAGVKLVYKAASSTAPAVTFGTALTASDGWAELPANGIVTATNGYKITVALVADPSGLPLSAGNTTVVAAS